MSNRLNFCSSTATESGGKFNHPVMVDSTLRLGRSWERLDLMRTTLIGNRKGFTLLELMSVLVIMGVIFSVAIKRYDLLSDSASITALKAGVRELNTQETLVWIDVKLSDVGWTSDADVYSAVGKNLGQGYRWNPGPTITGGTLHHKSRSVALVRNQSTRHSSGSWN